MRRREFLITAGALVAWPRESQSQPVERTHTVGVLLILSEALPEHRAWFAAFQEEILRIATSAGRVLKIEQRWTNGDATKARAYAAELVATESDVIFCVGTPIVAALHAQTASIPIVFVGVSDPVGAKFVASLSHPGGNITGFVQNERRLGGKWLALLKEAAPNIGRVDIMFNPDTAPGHGAYFLESFEAASRSLGVDARVAPVHNEADIQVAVDRIGAESGGLVLMDDGYIGANSKTVIAAAAGARVPTISGVVTVGAESGLLGYFTDMTVLFRNAAGYVIRILQGESPADLPVQTPAKYQLVINLRVASALGLEIPRTLLAAATEVIE